ncbi:MAG: AMP-binding protein [Oscillospiraceae bacterium]|jgi:long-chain acyl-CoA synthetase|nr:AMP-binding protein [Oscillospiraceae bacterium]
MKNAPYPLNTVDIPVKTLNELLAFTLTRFQNRTAFRYRDQGEIKTATYARFVADAKQLAAHFLENGFHNTNIAVIGENSYFWMLTYFAATGSGNVIVPIDNQLPDDDVIHILKSSGACAFVFSGDYADLAGPVKEQVKSVKLLINMKTDMPALLENSGKISANDAYFIESGIKENDLAAIVYTSGTTGAPKGVMLSHKNILEDAKSGCRFMDIALHETMVILPMHHTLSSTPGVVAQLMGGSTVSICSGAKNISKDFLDFKPEYTIMVPLIVEAMYKKIWETAKSQNKDKLLKKMIKISNALLNIGIDLRRKLFKSVLAAFGGNLQWVLSGGAALGEEYVLGFRAFGIDILQAYGISECSPGVSLNRNRYKRDGSVGVLLDCNKVLIANADETGIGEIYVKGSNVMLGYYNDPKATEDAFDGEWFKTGDLGYLDEDGFLFITGRMKNLIILSNGKNVSPEELEYKILALPYVLEVLVYQEGDRILAELFLDEENFPDREQRIEADILALNRTLPQYKYIAKTIIRDTEFPKTTSKKIKRKS